ncbi:SRPBCC family protein [Bdellovibrio svalbardensis]|uniref:SRPBCC family protein n=1 Tax=Bdellovibrio svalbardensis TaxID=2972972 RepID=A0ABT6DMT6_9BACT|nr:SRPBCC family protein [Bdellovibrio svalbardensis]MDG0818190.1 SRPBCC family protein [Bdellovibrio svalbardensis]
MATELKLDSKLDLAFERTTSLPVEKIWKGWTDPETLMKWFCPKPWKVTECRIDLRPGGEFYTLMQGPEGEIVPNNGCLLEVVENKKLVWTNMMTQDFRPMVTDSMGFPLVATLLLTKTEKGTFYQAIVRHADEEGRKKHEAMGFKEGWGLAFDQLVDLMKS